jgi:hypothetical protein
MNYQSGKKDWRQEAVAANRKEPKPAHEFVYEKEGPGFLDAWGQVTMLPSQASTNAGMRNLMILGIESFLDGMFQLDMAKKFPSSAYSTLVRERGWL